MISQKTCLILGGGGNVGTDVALLLREHDNAVISASRFSDPARKARQQAAGIETVHFDALKQDLSALPQQVDYVFLMQIIMNDANERPLQAYELNVMTSGRACEYWRQAAGIVVTGSFNTYGAPGHVIVDEDTPPEPRTVYESTRHAQEIIVSTLCRMHGTPGIILRICRGQSPEGGMFRQIAGRLLAGQQIPIESGRQTNVIDHRDLVRYIALSCEHVSLPVQRINLSGAEPVATVDMIAELARRLNVPAPTFDELAAEPHSLAGTCHKLVELMGPPQYALQDTYDRVAASLK